MAIEATPHKGQTKGSIASKERSPMVKLSQRETGGRSCQMDWNLPLETPAAVQSIAENRTLFSPRLQFNN